MAVNHVSQAIDLMFEQNPIRVEACKDGDLWFHAGDICDALGFANPWDAVATHVDEDDLAKREVIDAIGRKQQANFVNESGMYCLIFGSQLPSAKRFRRWVSSEVLPHLYRYGYYEIPQMEPGATFNENMLAPGPFLFVRLAHLCHSLGNASNSRLLHYLLEHGVVDPSTGDFYSVRALSAIMGGKLGKSGIARALNLFRRIGLLTDAGIDRDALVTAIQFANHKLGEHPLLGREDKPTSGAKAKPLLQHLCSDSHAAAAEASVPVSTPEDSDQGEHP